MPTRPTLTSGDVPARGVAAVGSVSAAASGEPGRTPAGGSAARGRRRRRLGGVPWWFLAPGLALYAFVVLIPSVRGSYFAFTDWDGLGRTVNFVGLENFREVFADDEAYAAVKRTLLIAAAITVIQNLVGLLLALGVHSRIKSRNLLRVFLFAPAVLTPVVTGFLWRNLLSPTGAVNSVMDTLGLSSLKQDWLGDGSVALWAIVGVIVWQYCGYSMVIFLAGMQGIPDDIIEAATVDGASPVRRFWSITLPLLAPALTINLMLSLIGGIKLFDQVFAMTGGGPGNDTQTLSTMIYKQAFAFGKFYYSATLAVVLTIVVVLLASVQFRALRRSEGATQ